MYPVTALFVTPTKVIALEYGVVVELQPTFEIVSKIGRGVSSVVLLALQTSASLGPRITLPSASATCELRDIRGWHPFSMPHFVGIMELPGWSGVVVNFVDYFNHRSVGFVVCSILLDITF